MVAHATLSFTMARAGRRGVLKAPALLRGFGMGSATGSVWMASPPEVLSAALRAGPGVAPMVTSAAEWAALGAKHASAATELTTVLSAMQPDAWEGAGAESYVAKHVPYVEWLIETRACC